MRYTFDIETPMDMTPQALTKCLRDGLVTALGARAFMAYDKANPGNAAHLRNDREAKRAIWKKVEESVKVTLITEPE